MLPSNAQKINTNPLFVILYNFCISLLAVMRPLSIYRKAICY